jgi:hypothetical protein
MVKDHLFAFNTAEILLGMDRTSFEQHLAEFYTILQEHLQVTLEMLEVGIFSHSSLLNTRVVQLFIYLVTVLAREDVGVHLHALQTVNEQFQLCEWGTVILENCIIVQKCLNHGMHLLTQSVHVLPCSNRP